MGNATVALGAAAPSDPNSAYNLQSFYQSAASPFVLYARDYRNSRTPYTRQANLTVQQQVTDRIVIEAGYIGSAAKRLPLVTTRGFNNEWFCTVSKNGCDALNPVFTLSNQGESNYNSLMARVRVAQYHGLTFNAAYSWSKSLDNASSASFPAPKCVRCAISTKWRSASRRFPAPSSCSPPRPCGLPSAK